MHIDERIQAMSSANPQSQKEADGIVKVDRRKFNKRHPDSGRKATDVNLIARGIKSYIDAHYNENVKIEVVDPKTGSRTIIDKPRVVRVLEVLYDIGIKDRNPDALSKWLDRALGKPKQVVAGDDDHPPFQLQVNIVQMLNRAYGQNNET